jgi:cytochrome P450
MKTESHFEYRSLGSSAFTPQRVAIIFRMVKRIVQEADDLSVILNKNKDFFVGNDTALGKLRRELISSKPYSGDLLKIWGV